MANAMERVLGIGGVFLRARDPSALGRWYRDHLGIALQESWGGAVFPLTTPHDTAGSYVVWAAFPHATDYFGRPENACMVNFRVRDLDAMLRQLRAAGCDVEPDTRSGAFGKFGWVTDPEGHRVELWEPPAAPPPDPAS